MSLTKTLNVVILPNEEVKRQSIEWSKIVSNNYKTKFTLDGINFYPHITLYLACYPEKNIELIQTKLNNLTKNISSFEITLAKFSTLLGFIFYEVLPNKILKSTHLKVLASLNELRDGELIAEDRKRLTEQEVPDHIKESIRKYGYALAKASYSPHITITRLTHHEEAESAKLVLDEKNMKFKVDKIYLTTVGPDGTCTGIIAEFPLKNT